MAIRVSRGLRNLALLALLLVLLVAWRIFSPYSIPRLMDMLGGDLIRLLSQPYFQLGGVPVTPTFLIKSFLFLVVLALVMRFGRRLVRLHILEHTTLDPGQKYAAERVTGYFVLALGLVLGLQSAGIDLSSLLVMGGAVGIGIGFGLQNIAKNFISGLILLVERPVKVGDRVEVGELNGDVVHIGARATWVRTNDNVVVVVPNSEFVETRVTNWTANDRQVRFAIAVGVSYGSDPENVRQVLLQVAAAHADVLSIPAPDVIFNGFGDSALNFELRVWTITQVQTPTVLASELYYAIFPAFRKAGIEIPFPQRDLHVRSFSLPVPVRRVEGK